MQGKHPIQRIWARRHKGVSEDAGGEGRRVEVGHRLNRVAKGRRLLSRARGLHDTRVVPVEGLYVRPLAAAKVALHRHQVVPVWVRMRGQEPAVAEAADLAPCPPHERRRLLSREEDALACMQARASEQGR